MKKTSLFLSPQAAESSFAEIRALVDRRQAEVIQGIRRITEEKRRALEDQLALIESERSLVREQCDQLNSLVSWPHTLF